MDLTDDQIAACALAGLELLEKELPMSRTLRRQIGLLELVLQSLATGTHKTVEVENQAADPSAT